MSHKKNAHEISCLIFLLLFLSMPVFTQKSNNRDLWKSNQAKMLFYEKEWKYLPELPESRQLVAKYDVRARGSHSKDSLFALTLSAVLFIIPQL